MTAPAKRLLVIEHDADLGELLRTVLTSEGYEARSVLESPRSLEEVREWRPDLLLVDLLPTGPGEHFALLDALRADDVAKRVPVLAMTTAEPLAESAGASYNVRASLTKPFDLDELSDKVREALGHAPLHAAVPRNLPPPEGVLARAEQIIAEHSREALFRWVQRLRRQSPWREHADLRLSEYLNNIPVLVEAVAAALHYGSGDDFLQRQPAAAERLREHVRLRRSQQFSLASLLREYSILRDELWAILWRHLPSPLATSDAYALQRVVAPVLDQTLELTVVAYLQDSSGGTAGGAA